MCSHASSHNCHFHTSHENQPRYGIRPNWHRFGPQILRSIRLGSAVFCIQLTKFNWCQLSCTIFRSDFAPTFQVMLSRCHNTPTHPHSGHSIIFTLLRSIRSMIRSMIRATILGFVATQLSFVIFHSCG